MNFIRKFKLHKLNLYEYKDSLEEEQFKFITDYFLDLNLVTISKFPNFSFYFKENKHIFDTNKTNYFIGVSEEIKDLISKYELNKELKNVLFWLYKLKNKNYSFSTHSNNFVKIIENEYSKKNKD